MKMIGIALIVVGITCFAFVFSGVFAWTTPAPEAASPASLAETLAVRMLLLSAIGVLFTIGGCVTLVRSVLKSRGEKLADKQ